MPTQVDAVILCGGAGLRLRSVTGIAPKSLARIGERPFLEILVTQLARHGFQRVILAVGYQREMIRAHFGDRVLGLSVEYAIESAPLGTGGALRNAVGLIESGTALVMNGDSYTDADLVAFAADFRDSEADISMLVTPADGRVDCGLVSISHSGCIIGFREKQATHGELHVNAGIYMAAKALLSGITPRVPVSLESELFPQWLEQGRRFRAYRHSGRCIDIGTPERYQNAQHILAGAEMCTSLAETLK